MPGKIKDLTGQRFNRLQVLAATDRRIGRNVVWKCLCDCGNQVEVKGGDLINRKTKSCGCLRSETCTSAHVTHGQAHTKISWVWTGIKQRCFNPKSTSYKNYGGRGITMCKEWQESFTAFYNYVSALPHFGEEGYSIDRIDNDGNYEPGNVKWSTRSEQTRNRRPYHRKRVEDYV